MTVNLAFLGAAHVHADYYAPSVQMRDDSDLRLVWDHDVARGRAWAERFDTTFEGDLDAVLARDDIHGVVLTCEADMHVEMIDKCAAAGKHILCEKPMALTLGECDQIIDILKRDPVTFVYAFPMHWNPVNLEIKRMIDEGELGTIGMMRVRHGHNLVYTPLYTNTWKSDPDRAGGGAMIDQGIHAVMLVRWFLGEPLNVMARLRKVQEDHLRCEDNAIAIFETESGALAETASAWTWRAATNTIEIFGSKGTAILKGSDVASKQFATGPSLAVHIHGRDDGWREPEVENTFQGDHFHGGTVGQLIDCIRDGTPSPVDEYAGRRALEIVKCAEESQRLAAAVDIPAPQTR
jgi:predicted dehydrogenase